QLFELEEVACTVSNPVEIGSGIRALCDALIRCQRTAKAVKRRSAKPDFSESAASRPPHRLDHYELMTDEEGKLIELGRGATGITYKALDIDLRRPVTLKVISEKYLGNESLRLRFLREARAAASVRHPNVASVFHLGKTGKSCFYAMEFVEGETLENLINESEPDRVAKNPR